MRRVIVPDALWSKIADLKEYLVGELKLSETAAERRIDRFDAFLVSLGAPVTHSLCRFVRWRRLGYRCAVFEKSWVFAYEVFDDGVIVRDMSHGKMLAD